MFKWLFKKNEKRVTADMDNLYNCSIMIIALLITRRNNIDNMEVAGRKAAASTNYLFGNSIDIYSPKEIEEAKSYAIKLISDDFSILELVIQSLRIKSMIIFSKGENPEHLGMELLEKFGAKVPNKPDPDNHRKLLKTLIEKQPESLQQDLFGYMAMFKLV